MSEFDFHVTDEMIKVIRARFLMDKLGITPSKALVLSFKNDPFLYSEFFKSVLYRAIPDIVEQRAAWTYGSRWYSYYVVDNPHLSEHDDRLAFFDNIMIALVRKAKREYDGVRGTSSQVASVP